uniref:Uncharacterized protein n=1 Tax=viral metagenome TaxID=1070528 RepID=A0A6M3J233_9ZZZZ
MPEQIVFIEFQNGRPFSVIAHDGKGYSAFYDIEWSDAFQWLYYDNSGSGGHRFEINISLLIDFWIADHMQAVCNGEPVEKTMEIPEEYYGWLDDWATEGRCEYCAVCEDHFPAYDECQHVYWSHVMSMYAGCGCDDGGDSSKLSFFAFLEKTGIALELRTAICMQEYYAAEDTIRLCGIWFDERLEDLSSDEINEIADGIDWLNSMEPGVTTEAEKLTVKWIDEYLMKKREIVFRKRKR